MLRKTPLDHLMAEDTVTPLEIDTDWPLGSLGFTCPEEPRREMFP
jgi:hypothetical protein